MKNQDNQQKKRAVIYARYSTGPNQTDKSIEGQIIECTQFAKKHDIQIVGEYIDRAQSGKTDNRADFQKMINDSCKNLFDLVIVWKIDRFGRNREEIAVNKMRLQKNGVQVLYAMEHIPEGPEGILLESLLEGLAEYYSENLRQNVLRGMKVNAMQCKSTGSGRSLGYKTKADKTFEIDEIGAQTVKMIFEMFDQGKKYVEIIDTLNEKGLKTVRGNKFNKNSIGRILRNRRYIGEYCWHDIIIPNGMPRIIEDDLFYRVQEKLDKKKKATARSRGKINYLLTGKLFCGHCGKRMVGDAGTSKTGFIYSYYVCSGRKYHENNCKKRRVNKEALERRIIQITITKVLEPEMLEELAEKIANRQRQDYQEHSMLPFYKDRLKQINKSIENLIKAIAEGIMSEAIKKKLSELEEEKSQLEINILQEQSGSCIMTKDQILFYFNRFCNGDIESSKYYQDIINVFISSIWLYDDKLVITYNLNDQERESIALDVINNVIVGEGEMFGIDTFASTRCNKPELYFYSGKMFGIIIYFE